MKTTTVVISILRYVLMIVSNVLLMCNQPKITKHMLRNWNIEEVEKNRTELWETHANMIFT